VVDRYDAAEQPVTPADAATHFVIDVDGSEFLVLDACHQEK
jgi:hypothetical protein